MSIKPQYQATPDTLEDGQFTGLRVDSTGALVISESASAPSVSAIGDPSDTAWDGTNPNATVIALLKAIAINTTPTP